MPEPGADDLTLSTTSTRRSSRRPQYRRLTFITLQPEDLLNEIEVPEDKIQAEYQNRIEQFRTPERRTVEQLLAPDQAAVEKAKRAARDGRDLCGRGGELADQGVSSDSLDKVAKADLPPEIGAAIFDMTEGQVSEPVKSGFGWHLFKVTGLEPEKVTPLAEVHDQLRRDLALSEARDRLPTLATQLDDELAGGVQPRRRRARARPGGQVAGRDRRSRQRAGWQAPRRPAALAEVSNSRLRDCRPGRPTLLEETDSGGYFVLKVDEITPPRVKSVDEVHHQLREHGGPSSSRELARERADQIC